MGKRNMTNYALYRWRYVIWNITLAAILLFLIVVVGLFAPGGVSDREMASVVASNATTPAVITGNQPEHVVHSPYHLLQNASISLLSVTPLSIKLPSLILATLSIGLLYGLLRLWFRRNTALITSVLAITTGQFLLMAQLGTPDVTYLFWNVSLLAATSLLARTKKYRPVWMVLVAAVAALSLYSPLELYIVIPLIATCIIHPHARFTVFKQRWWVLLLSSLVFIGLLLPLILSCLTQPELLKELLGVPSNFSQISWNYLADLGNQYTGFINPISGAAIRPAYGLGIIALALVGLFRLFTAKYTAKSYIITIWLMLLLPLLIFHGTAAYITLLPIVLLVAFAIDYLIRSWYRLFPRNPYARVAGLLPLAVLVIALSFSNTERFVYGYHYDSHATAAFTKDVKLLQDELDTHAGTSTTLVVPQADSAFYTIMAEKRNDAASIRVSSDISNIPTSDLRIVARDFHDSIVNVPSSIILDSTAENADRFYLYKNTLN